MQSSMQQRLCELLPRMRRFARGLAGNPHDADDLVQTALERALARASQHREDMPLEGWLFGIVRNALSPNACERCRLRRQTSHSTWRSVERAPVPVS